MSIFSFALYGCLLLIFGADIAWGQDPNTYILPNEPKTPVIVLAYEGGFTPQRVNDEPELQILADGTVILGAPFGQMKRVVTTVETSRLHQMLQFILEDQQFPNFDQDSLQDTVRSEQVRRGQGLTITDAPTTIIRITADDNTYETKVYALSQMSQEYPEVGMLNRLESIRRYLEAYRTEVYAGGEQGIARYVEIANQKLQEQFPNVLPLTKEDIQGIWQFANNDVSVSFVREEQTEDSISVYTSVDIKALSGQTHQVNAFVNASTKN